MQDKGDYHEYADETLRDLEKDSGLAFFSFRRENASCRSRRKLKLIMKSR